VKSYKRDCFLCQLVIFVTSRVLDKCIKREREAHRLLQQIDTDAFQSLVHGTNDIGEKTTGRSQ